MNVVLRSASPLFTARNQFQLDHALGAEVDLDRAVERLAAEWDDDAEAFSKCGFDLRLVYDLGEAWRSDLFLTFAHQHDVDRRLVAGGLERVQGGETCDLRALLICCSAADDDLANARFVDETRFGRRRAPL